MSRPRLAAALLAAAVFTLPVAAQPAPTLAVAGEGGTSRVYTVAELSALRQIEAIVEENSGSRTVFRGPSIRELMTRQGAPSGPALRGRAMLLAVVAEASDGYRAGYMLSEIDEQFGGRVAIVALTQDGQPLPARDGPLRVVVPEDRHRARWVRQLVRLRLVTLE